MLKIFKLIIKSSFTGCLWQDIVGNLFCRHEFLHLHFTLLTLGPLLWGFLNGIVIRKNYSWYLQTYNKTSTNSDPSLCPSHFNELIDRTKSILINNSMAEAINMLERLLQR